MRINHNIAALNTYNQLSQNNKVQQNSLEKLSSGLRINSAADDAAGLAISEKMRGQIRGLEMATKNAQDGISTIQTAEGALNETHSILQRMRELAVQASNDTNTEDDRAEIQRELNELVDEVDRIADETEFNTQKLLDGSLSGSGNEMVFHIGANQDQNIELEISNMSASGLEATSIGSGNYASGTISDLKVDDIEGTVSGGAGGEDGVLTQSGANAAITLIDDAIQQVSETRSNLGANQNRLEHTVNNLGTAAENLTAAESRIRDVDMAKEMMNFTKTNILSQASQSMLEVPAA